MMIALTKKQIKIGGNALIKTFLVVNSTYNIFVALRKESALNSCLQHKQQRALLYIFFSLISSTNSFMSFASLLLHFFFSEKGGGCELNYSRTLWFREPYTRKFHGFLSSKSESHNTHAYTGCVRWHFPYDYMRGREKESSLPTSSISKTH